MDKQLRKAEHLRVDPPVVLECHKPTFTQTWALASFVSPDDRIKQRFLFEANRFLYHDVNKQLIDVTSHLTKDINTRVNSIIERKIATYQTASDPIYKAAAELLLSVKKDLQLNEDEQVDKTLRTYRIDQEEMTDRFDVYKSTNNKELEVDFNKEFTDTTSIRGFKIRGIFEDLDEARARAKKVHEEIEPFVNTFVFPAGYWVPWDPNADAVQDQEYMIPELNDLMAQKKENAAQRDDFYAKRKQMMIDDAKKSNDKVLHDKLEQRLTERKNERQGGRLK